MDNELSQKNNIIDKQTTDDPDLYIDRELSWLSFNERVLEEAENTNNPLMERFNFLSIFQNNLEEFYMVRVGALTLKYLGSDEPIFASEKKKIKKQLQDISEKVRQLNERKTNVYRQLCIQLENDTFVKIKSYRQLSKEEKIRVEQTFIERVAPFLSPIISDEKNPFPFLENKQSYTLMNLRTKKNKEKTAVISYGSLIPSLIRIDARNFDEDTFYILREDIIENKAEQIFPNYFVMERTSIKVTRNSVLPELNGSISNLKDKNNNRDFMSTLLEQRKRLAPVKVECSRNISEKFATQLSKQLHVPNENIITSSVPLDFSFISEIKEELQDRIKLFYPKKIPVTPKWYENKTNMLDTVMDRDILLHYPYNNMKPFLKLLKDAANDDNVKSIKITLYRVADQSEIINSLIEAAENGKEVTVCVELRARFDEEHNIELSKKLEEAGCHIIYGLDGLKVHSKMCLITKVKEGEKTLITQIGTGNYNEATAKIYTDFSLMTSSPEIGRDTEAFFNCLEHGQTVDKSEHLLISPNCLQDKIIEMIDGEIQKAKSGSDAFICFKVNSLTDPKIMKKLVEASQAGVLIRLGVRGICCLKPHIIGYTDNIQISSIVGRYLEHSRVYLFGRGKEEKYYIASADLMTRNTEQRVEVAVPIYDKAIKDYIKISLNLFFGDTVNRRILLPSGEYKRVQDYAIRNSQEKIYDYADGHFIYNEQKRHKWEEKKSILSPEAVEEPEEIEEPIELD